METLKPHEVACVQRRDRPAFDPPAEPSHGRPTRTAMLFSAYSSFSAFFPWKSRNLCRNLLSGPAPGMDWGGLWRIRRLRRTFPPPILHTFCHPFLLRTYITRPRGETRLGCENLDDSRIPESTLRAQVSESSYPNPSSKNNERSAPTRLPPGRYPAPLRAGNLVDPLGASPPANAPT